MSEQEQYYKGENEVLKKSNVKYSEGTQNYINNHESAILNVEQLLAENKRLSQAIEDMVKASCRSSDKIERLREALEKLSNYLHGNCPECGDYKAEEMQELAKQALEENK